MAASENQGLHIALIILFILVLLLSVASFMFFKQAQDNEKFFNEAKAATSAAAASETKMQGEFNEIMKLVGLEATGEQDLERIKQTFSEDMAKFGGTVPDDKKSYHAALEELYNSLNAAQVALVEQKDQVTSLTAANKSFEAGSKQQVTAAETAKAEAIATRDAEKTRADAAEKKLTEERDAFVAQIAVVQQSNTSEAEKATKEIADLKRQIGTYETKVGDLKTALEPYKVAPNAVADGEIRLINQRSQVVWLNIGSADKLRRGTTFSVFSPDDQVGSEGKSKARVEVTQIIGEHLAEARILEDELRNPILPGDKIFTNLWTPGRPEHVAIIGRIDLDGDSGTDEAARLANIVTLNGGTVDAMLGDDGTLNGKLSVGTRYLIVGEAPSERARPIYDRIREEAKQLGVEPVSSARFLDNIGWKPVQQVVRFGHNSNIDKVMPDVPDGGMPRSDNGMMPDADAFKKRLPPAGSTTTGRAYVPFSAGG